MPTRLPYTGPKPNLIGTYSCSLNFSNWQTMSGQFDTKSEVARYSEDPRAWQYLRTQIFYNIRLSPQELDRIFDVLPGNEHTANFEAQRRSRNNRPTTVVILSKACSSPKVGPVASYHYKAGAAIHTQPGGMTALKNSGCPLPRLWSRVDIALRT